MQTYGEKLTDQQEVLLFAADLIIETFLAESALMRARQGQTDDPARAGLHVHAARVGVQTGASRVEAVAKEALAAMATGDTLRTLQAALRRWLKAVPADLVSARRALAAETVARRGYVFALS
jgi:hypothetical protein